MKKQLTKQQKQFLIVVGIIIILLILKPAFFPRKFGPDSGNFDKFNYHWEWNSDTSAGYCEYTRKTAGATANVDSSSNIEVIASASAITQTCAAVGGQGQIKITTTNFDIKQKKKVLLIGDMSVSASGRRGGASASASIGITDGTNHKEYGIDVASAGSITSQTFTKSAANIMIEMDEFTGNIIIGSATIGAGVAGSWLQKGTKTPEEISSCKSACAETDQKCLYECEGTIRNFDDDYTFGGDRIKLDTSSFDKSKPWNIFLASSASASEMLAPNAKATITISGIAEKYTPKPPCAESWECTAWSTCANNQQSRTCSDKNNCGTTTSKPQLSQSCIQCLPNWQCSEWSCINNQKSRICADTNNCGTTANQPSESQPCISCTESWECTAWSTCANNQQSRTCSDKNNCGTTVNKPTSTQYCTIQCSPNWICEGWSTCINSNKYCLKWTDKNNCNLAYTGPNFQVCASAQASVTEPKCTPKEEVCNNIDDDCDLLIDENNICAGKICTSNWITEESECINNIKTIIKKDLNECYDTITEQTECGTKSNKTAILIIAIIGIIIFITIIIKKNIKVKK